MATSAKNAFRNVHVVSKNRIDRPKTERGSREGGMSQDRGGNEG